MADDGPLQALQRQLNELKAENQRLAREQQEARISQMPAAERPIYQQQMELEQQRAELASYRGQLNEAARKIHARELASETGLPADDFMKFESTHEMDRHAVESVMSLTKNPALAKLVFGEGGAPATEATTDPKTAATKTAPAGVSAAPTGAQAGQGAAVLGADPVQGILSDKNVGRGSGNMEGFLNRALSEIPFQEFALGDPAYRMPGAPVQA